MTHEQEKEPARRMTWRGWARLVVGACLFAFLILLGYDMWQLYPKVKHSLDDGAKRSIEIALTLGGIFLATGIVAAVGAWFWAKKSGFKNPADWARSAMLAGDESLWVMMLARGGREVAPDKDLYDDGIEQMGKVWLWLQYIFFGVMAVISIVAYLYVRSE